MVRNVRGSSPDVPDTFYRYRSLRVVLFHSLILHILFRRIAPDNGYTVRMNKLDMIKLLT